jgi:hypothetical protein
MRDAATLVRDQHVLLILDGLDEMDPTPGKLRKRLTLSKPMVFLSDPFPSCSSSAFKTPVDPRWRPPSRSACPLAGCTSTQPARRSWCSTHGTPSSVPIWRRVQALGVQVGCTLNVHGDTVTSKQRPRLAARRRREVARCRRSRKPIRSRPSIST